MFLSSDNELWIATQDGLNKLIASGDSFKFERHRLPGTGPGDLHNYIFRCRRTPARWQDFSVVQHHDGLVKVTVRKMELFTVPGKPSPYSFMRCVIAVDGPNPFIIAGSEMGLHFFDVNTSAFKKFLNNEESRGNLSQSTFTFFVFRSRRRIVGGYQTGFE
jgi:hypothetical protein